LHTVTPFGPSGALHLRTPDLDQATAQLSAIFPEGVAQTSSGTASYAMGSVMLTLHEEILDEFLRDVSDAVPPRRGLSCLLAGEFHASDLSVAKAWLRTSGVRFSGSSERLAVGPTEGFGRGIIIRLARGSAARRSPLPRR
jgi:hypothetical protein